MPSAATAVPAVALSPGTGGKVPGADGTAAPDAVPGVAAADAALEGPGG